MKNWLPSYLDEMTKLSRMTKDEERRQALQFAGLGAASVPVASAIANLIEHGRTIGRAKSFPRWLGARAASGGLVFGALPAARHALERVNIQKAKEQRELNKKLVQLHTKTSAQSGADLRLPVMGGTKFPTRDSLSGANKLLKKHQEAAQPKLSPLGLKDIVPDTGQDVMPKVGEVMDLNQDPLIQYLKRKMAAEQVPPLKVNPAGSGSSMAGTLDDNIAEMKTGPEEKELSTEHPMPPKKDSNKRLSGWHAYLNNAFTNRSGITRKYTENDRAPGKGSVDKEVQRG